MPAGRGSAAPMGPAVGVPQSGSSLSWSREVAYQGPGPWLHPFPFLPSRHCGRREGSPYVLGLRGPGRAAVSVGQGKRVTTQGPWPCTACSSCHFSPGDTHPPFILFLGKVADSFCFCLVGGFFTCFVLEGSPQSYSNSHILPARARTHLVPFELDIFLLITTKQDKKWSRNRCGEGTMSARCSATSLGPESPWLVPLPSVLP